MIRCNKCGLSLTLQLREEVLKNKIMAKVCLGLAQFCREMQKKCEIDIYKDYERKFLAFNFIGGKSPCVAWR